VKAAIWILIALVVPGGSLFALGAWLYRHRQDLSRDETIDSLIRPPLPKFGKLSKREYEAVLKDAADRRARVAAEQRDAAQIASGQPPVERPRLITRSR
jgi:hypothetical protein